MQQKETNKTQLKQILIYWKLKKTLVCTDWSSHRVYEWKIILKKMTRKIEFDDLCDYGGRKRINNWEEYRIGEDAEKEVERCEPVVLIIYR